MNILNEKHYFQRSKNFKLFRQIKGNSLYNCIYLKFTISVMGDFCNYLTWVPNSLATPLSWNNCSCLPLPMLYSTQLIVQGLTLGVGQDWRNNQLFPRNFAKHNVMSGKTSVNIMEERSK